MIKTQNLLWKTIEDNRRLRVKAMSDEHPPVKR